MTEISFNAYKIAPKINLKRIAFFFKVPEPESWEDFIALGEAQLIEIYKYRVPMKKVYIFEYGCVVFENFKPDETGEFLRNIRLITGELDYKLLAQYGESHVIKLTKDRQVRLWKTNSSLVSNTAGMTDMLAVVLAKSAALSKEEADVNLLLDKAESLISNRSKGAFIAGKSEFSAIIASILRFEYECAAAIKLFDRPSEVVGNILLKEIYDELAEYYELEDRYGVLEKKISELRKIVRSYSSLKYHKQEKRLLIFEIFLLVLFPLFRVLDIFI